jgi:hypothetical protein
LCLRKFSEALLNVKLSVVKVLDISSASEPLLKSLKISRHKKDVLSFRLELQGLRRAELLFQEESLSKWLCLEFLNAVDVCS